MWLYDTTESRGLGSAPDASDWGTRIVRHAASVP